MHGENSCFQASQTYRVQLWALSHPLARSEKGVKSSTYNNCFNNSRLSNRNTRSRMEVVVNRSLLTSAEWIVSKWSIFVTFRDGRGKKGGQVFVCIRLEQWFHTGRASSSFRYLFLLRCCCRHLQ